MPTSALLQTIDLARRHPAAEAWLLDHVSLEIRAGDRAVVSGPSGAGKTLLLRAVAMLDPHRRRHGALARIARSSARRCLVFAPRSSTVINGRRCWPPPSKKRLRRPFALKIHRAKKFDRPWILERLARLGRQESFLEQPVANLSGGEMQMVALLRALQLAPQILLLDEPTAALDPKTSAAVEELVVDWIEESPDARALVWVSHDVEQGDRVATRKIYMENGSESRIRMLNAEC